MRNVEQMERCDLLKIRYLCGRNDNLCKQYMSLWSVVICSKFAIFAVEMTTHVREARQQRVL